MFALILSYRQLALHFLLGASLLSACASWSHRGSGCDLNANNASEVHGLRLGMTLEQFKAKFPYTSNIAPSSSEIIIPAPDKIGVITMPTWHGETIEITQLIFVDGRVAHFRVVYTDYTKWDDAEQFANKTSESLSLPKSWKSEADLDLKSNQRLWAIVHEQLWRVAQRFQNSQYHQFDIKVEKQYLFCDDVVVIAGLLDPERRYGRNEPFIQFDDLNAWQKVEEREGEERAKEKRAEEDRRKTFMP